MGKSILSPLNEATDISTFGPIVIGNVFVFYTKMYTANNFINTYLLYFITIVIADK